MDKKLVEIEKDLDKKLLFMMIFVCIYKWEMGNREWGMGKVNYILKEKCA